MFKISLLNVPLNFSNWFLKKIDPFSDPKTAPLDSLESNEPVMSQIHKTLGRAARQKQKLINQTIKKKSKLLDDR